MFSSPEPDPPTGDALRSPGRDAGPGAGFRSPGPDVPEGLDDFPEIPRPGALWPLVTVAVLLGMMGIYLMLPVGPGTPGAGSPLPAPVSVRTSAPSPPAAESRSPRLVFVDSEDSTFAASVADFARRVAELSGGTLTLEPVPGGRWEGKKLGELALMRLVQKGEIPLALLSTAPLSNLDPSLAVLDLPFLIEDYDHADRVMDGPVGRELLEGLRPHGLVGLAFLETGFRILSSSVPLPTLESLKGKKIRVMQSATYLRFVRALDGEPIPSGVDRIYEMGRQGFIDAADRSWPTYWDFHLYEVQRYVTETRHAYAGKALVANLQFWESLSPRDREALTSAAAALAREHRERQRLDEARVKQLAREKGIEVFVLTPEERARFVQRVQPLYREFEQRNGQDLVRRIREVGHEREDIRSPGTDEVH